MVLILVVFDIGIDIFKDAVSLPAVPLKYLLQGTLGKGNTPEFYALKRQAYDMLKKVAVGGPSLVIIRKHEVRKTIQAFQYKEADASKLLGNSAYGKLIEAIEKQTKDI